MMILAPLSLLTGVLGFQLIPLYLNHTAREKAAWPVITMAIALLIGPAIDLATKVKDHGIALERMVQVNETARYLNGLHKDVTTTTTMFVWGFAPELYKLTASKPASRFIYPLPLLTPRYADEKLIHTFIAEIENAAPTFIVDASGGDYAIPTLSKWNAQWHFPDRENPHGEYWLGRSYWEMPPSLKRFYDYVESHYSLAGKTRPYQWTIYVRTDAKR